MQRRWDGDERDRGVGDAAGLVPEAERLLAAMSEPWWVAEEPELHLLPHLERFCARPGSLLVLAAHETTADGGFVVRLGWRGALASWGEPRAAAFALLGEIAEPAVFTRERHESGDLVLDAVTGVLDGDSAFAPHGHTLQLRVERARG